MHEIERMRLERGWTKAELARRSGVSSGTIAAIESGASRGILSTQILLLTAFGLSSRERRKVFPSFEIIRFWRAAGRRKIIRRGLSLEEARAHCAQPESRGEDWFDGFHRSG